MIWSGDISFFRSSRYSVPARARGMMHARTPREYRYIYKIESGLAGYGYGPARGRCQFFFVLCQKSLRACFLDYCKISHVTQGAKCPAYQDIASYMIENQKETPQEKTKSTPIVIVIVIVAHSTSFSIRPKTTGRKCGGMEHEEQKDPVA